MKQEDLRDADCGIAQAAAVIGDWQSLLILREVAGGNARFEGIQRELGISRRALTERLLALVEDGVLHKQQYLPRPPRFDYLLTQKGEGFLPVLIALQDWGTRHIAGDGELTATTSPGSLEFHRVHELIGTALPALALPGHDGELHPLASASWQVLYFFPGAYAPSENGYPRGWERIPGAPGCTLESKTFAQHYGSFQALGVEVAGVSMQRPDQLEAFAKWAEIPFPLLSDQDGKLAATLRLPTFRASGLDRFKRFSLMVDPGGIIGEVQLPITDPAGSVTEALGYFREQLSVSR
ncbi:DNA-binding HxlR family transcriptional regulator/peroxiredoxin [Psychromicrobium silvestre]|uniref:DNA-binding HxlR family transcriptional regulator/peroxiredoxin n=1 Tax=Psychromicrobium silvestre TaxID=1645614 RepID=A0A7Y9S3M0_9MICC|nr:winged helix-turn-helix transcriptional regulator [Psychromicrobium silvestre]NYE93904.1 DNA-binding HxlR family transcriptional regulator/peroxiredoxin [Psychromicrobium silvestre]